MRALITGANGFVGSCLARRLTGRGDRVRCLVRETSDRTLLEGVAVDFALGDVTQPETLPTALDGVDVVFHLAGVRRSPERAVFFKVNADGTRRLLEAAAAFPRPPRVVLCSSLAAVGPSRDHPTEDAPLRPLDWYGESKAEAEHVARSFADRVPVTIARPSRILGPGDKENLAFAKLVKRGVTLSVGGGPRPMSTVDVEDVVEALVRMGERPEAVGQAFFVNRDTTTMEALQESLARAMGVRTRRLSVPAGLFSAIASAADVTSRATGRHLPLNRKLAQQILVSGWTCSTQKAKERLGFEARVSIEESLERSVRWYREKGWL